MNTFPDELAAFARSLFDGEHQLRSSLQWVCLSNSHADFHDNVIFFGFGQKSRDPILVAKVPRLIENGWMLRREHDRLSELWNCLGETAGNYIPKPYAITSVQGRPVLIISYVPGESLTSLSRRSFWGDSRQVAELAREAAHALRDLHHLTERSLEPDEHPALDFQKKAEAFRELFQLRADEERTLSDLVETVKERSVAATHEVLIQGDFWHGNMIRDRKRGKLMFVDWQFARWSADVSLDVYFFPLAGALFATDSASVDEHAKRAFHLLTGWRTNVIPGYLEAYGLPDRYMLLPPKYGMMLCCVEKAVRPALEFGYHHPDDVLWRSLFGELMDWPIESR
jgi:Phosphotransferase enzyme family